MDIYDRVRDAAQKSATLGKTRYQHASAILDSKGRLISIGRNHFRGEKVTVEDNHIIDKTLHSEIHALYKVNVRRLGGATIINYACTKANSINARPCDNCYSVLKKLGFTKMFYTVGYNPVDEPKWKEERF